ncbi:MAG: hypothetical protein H6555_10795 [Lewinellaceae bacterium]|nr:hypothetical protein [Lewinellaceae bacterium]
MKILPFLFFGLLVASSLGAQSTLKNQGQGILTGVSYALQLPAADLGQRFGSSFSAGLQTDYLTAKGNWLLGINGLFFFGGEVKENPLQGLQTVEGFIIGNDRTPAGIQLRERGFFLGGSLGKLWGLSARNPRSGIRFNLGAGFLQHKIRIQDDPARDVPQLNDTYKKGYDRLSNGLALQLWLGYQYLAADRRLNYFIGLEGFQAFTRNRRTVNFDTRLPDTTNRLDILLGLRAGIVLPFYLGEGSGILY